jgi:hypothetical protein
MQDPTKRPKPLGESTLRVLAIAREIGRGGKAPTNRAIAKRAELNPSTVQRHRAKLKARKLWVWPSSKGGWNARLPQKTSALDLAIIEAAGEIIDEGRYPSQPRIAERIGKTHGRVRTRVENMRRAGMWPFEVHRNGSPIDPETRETILEMASRPNVSPQGICRAIKKLTGRELSKSSVIHILKHPAPKLPLYMGEAATAGVYARAAKVRAEPTRGEPTRHDKHTQDAKVHRITLVNSTILRERRSFA